MPATISENEIGYSLIAKLNDTFTFRHANGQEVAVRILPRQSFSGKPTIYEKWQRVVPSRYHRLLTERGFEIVFELPLLFEYNLEQDGYPSGPAALMEIFFERMKGETFKHYPRELFK